ncbi:MAG: hypothetical protein IJO47_05665 [Clostridia bacterium]|nr:hypothetical protein [Clostridia bacterium]
MKKVILFLIAILFGFNLCACSSEEEICIVNDLNDMTVQILRGKEKGNFYENIHEIALERFNGTHFDMEKVQYNRVYIDESLTEQISFSWSGEVTNMYCQFVKIPRGTKEIWITPAWDAESKPQKVIIG